MINEGGLPKPMTGGFAGWEPLTMPVGMSSTGKAVNYHSKEGVSHGTTDHRPVLAG